MNPWAGLIVVVAILLIVVAWKGTQDNVIAALLNRPYKNSTVGGKGPGAATSSANPGSPTVNLASLGGLGGITA